MSSDTPLSFATIVLDWDTKRIHVIHDMLDAVTGDRLAVAELMFVHVRRESGKVEPMPDDQAEMVRAMAASHAGLPRPLEVGRRIGIRRA